MSVVSAQELRQAMAKFATGVAVVSSVEADGRIHGMTANSLTSVSLEPPLVLVCIARHRNTYRTLRDRGRFGINVLSQRQGAIAEYYARDRKTRAGDVAVSWQLNARGSPMLEGALVFLECQVVARYDHGDHAIFVAGVEKVVTRPGQPLLFYGRGYRGMDEQREKAEPSTGG